MESSVGSPVGNGARATLEIGLFGPLTVMRAGVDVALPRSRKVRALLALLALEGKPMSRSRLCDLLWDVPNDPKGELRWCLSKLRGVVDEPSHSRIVTTGQSLVSLDLTNASVDALELDRVGVAGVSNTSTEILARLGDLPAGEFLEGMQLDGAEISTWLISHRQRYRRIRIAIARELAARAAPCSEEAFQRWHGWLRLDPFELSAHESLIHALVKTGRARDAEAHVSTAMVAFEQEGRDWSALRAALASARAANVSVSVSIESMAPPSQAEPRPPRRGSVVVMPFAADSPDAARTADGVTDDIITRLAKLRALFVIARGTSYALRDRGIDARETGRILNVEYVVSGTLRRHGDRTSVLVEVAETRDGGIVWTDELAARPDEAFGVFDSIVDRIVASVAEEIEREETRRAIVKPPSSLDAWEAYHRGLWHMYKFTGQDNALAAKLFRDALALDPTFARAHAGLSFTHFQNVFLDLTPDRERQIALAVETAGQSLAADDRDPAAHWAMGRAHWLRNEQGEAVSELRRSVELSPNFALGHYTLGFVLAQSGEPRAAITSTDHSRELSPFDPLQFGMLGSRAVAHTRLGEHDEAATWAVRAARRPNAHAHILAIAATHLGFVQRRDEAREYVARIRTKLPSYDVEDFLRAFRFAADAEKILRKGARNIGFD